MKEFSTVKCAPDTVKEYVFPSRVVHYENAENTQSLLKEKELQITLNEKELTVVRKGGYVVLDFGRELSGGVRILASQANAKVRVRLGESVSETFSCAVGTEKLKTDDGIKIESAEKCAGCNDHALRDAEFFLTILSDQEYFQSGFRFVRLDALEKDVEIKSIVAVYTHANYRRDGFFKCENETVNRIYETAARTLTLCIQNGMLWDGIKRDRLVWVGDMYPEVLAGLDLYGNASYIRRAIDFSRLSTPLPEWMNTMPVYSLWWIMCLDEYVYRTGDTDAYFTDNAEYLKRLTEQFDGYVTDEGEVATPGIFLDWPSHDTPDEKAGVRAIAALSMRAADRLFRLDGYVCPHTKSVLEKLKRSRAAAKDKKQAIALSLIAGYDAQADLLIKGGAKGMSTFMSWAVLNAAHDYASPAAAAKMMEEYYGAMLKMGATSFWEDFDVEWTKGAAPVDRLPERGEKDIHGDFGKFCYVGFRHSLCHGWSAGVIDYIVTRILGVRITSPGGKTVSVKPFSAFGDMEGAVPVGGGLVRVKVENGKVSAEATCGIQVTVQE